MVPLRRSAAESRTNEPGSWSPLDGPIRLLVPPALVAQWIEHLTTDQKVGGSTPSERAHEVLVAALRRCAELTNAARFYRIFYRTAPIWRRPVLRRAAADAADRVAAARDGLAEAQERAAPHLAVIDAASAQVREAEHAVGSARLRERLDALTRLAPERSLRRDIGIGIER